MTKLHLTMFALTSTMLACGTSGSVQAPKSATPAVTKALPNAPTSSQFAALCKKHFSHGDTPKCTLNKKLSLGAGVAVMDVEGVSREKVQLLMADPTGQWHMVLALPASDEDNGAYVTSLEATNKVEVRKVGLGGAPVVVVETTQNVGFRDEERATYSGEGEHTVWCAWTATGPKCCGSVTRSVKVVRDSDEAEENVMLEWTLSLKLANGKATVTGVSGKVEDGAEKGIGTFDQCKFPINSTDSYANPMYGL